MATAVGDRTPLLAEEGVVRQRGVRQQQEKQWQSTDEIAWNPDLPYGGRVYLPRVKKPDPWWVTTLEVLAILFVVCLGYYAFYYFDNLHFHVTHGYAHLGYSTAQHQVGQRYLHGVGVEKDHHVAMEWFKKAADQGHAHASYNLAVGHLQGVRTDLLKKGEAHKLIAHAAHSGVKEADKVLSDICGRGGCEK